MGTIRVMVPQLMAENDMNITQLAELLGVTRVTASKIAKGKTSTIRIEYLAKLCELFGVEPGDILIYRPDKEGNQ